MKVSMVITTHNRGQLLRQSIQRLAGLTLPDELIIVDDGSEDDTVNDAEYIRDLLDCKVHYVFNDNPGRSLCSVARNIGVKLARNEWIVTSEPELIYRTDVLAQFAELEPAHPMQVVSAGTVYFLPPGWNSDRIEGLPTAGDYVPPNISESAIGWVAPFTALWKREWLTRVGGWDESFPNNWGWDDIDLLTRLCKLLGVGQHIALEVQALHQDHEKGGDVDFLNEQHFFAKSFNHGHERHTCPPDCPGDADDRSQLVANQREWWG